MEIVRGVFREYDIRGVADRDLTDGVVWGIGRAFAAELRERVGGGGLRVVVCRDGRLSSDRLFVALERGLREWGVGVVSVGVGPTPLLYFAAHWLGVAGAVMVTGSHNPGEDNGFKMMCGLSSFYGRDIQCLADRIEGEDWGEDVGVGGREDVDLCGEYVESVVGASRLGSGRVKVVVDGGNGSAGPLGLAVLRRLGYEPDALYCDIDGSFPNHHPDPTVLENLVALRERVVSTGASLGLAWDGDGDRLGVVDERGEVVWGDRLLMLFARELLVEEPGAVVLGEVKCSQVVYDDIASRGGRPIVWKTGHSLIKSKMREEGALLAGEMSGHIFFADRYYGFDDAIYAAVRLLEIVGGGERPLSDFLGGVRRTCVTPELRVGCPDGLKFGVVARVLAHYRGAGYSVLDIDGARVAFGEGEWGLCRASNTQPVLVMRFEAGTEARLEEMRLGMEGVVAAALVAEEEVCDG